jgi:hypothetical protein
MRGTQQMRSSLDVPSASEQCVGAAVKAHPSASPVQVLGAPQGLHDAPAAQDLGGQTAVHGRQHNRRAGICCGAPPQHIRLSLHISKWMTVMLLACMPCSVVC